MSRGESWDEYVAGLSDRLRLQPVQREDGTWDALDGDGYGHLLGYPTIQEAEAWIVGYECGAQENM